MTRVLSLSKDPAIRVLTTVLPREVAAYRIKCAAVGDGLTVVQGGIHPHVEGVPVLAGVKLGR